MAVGLRNVAADCEPALENDRARHIASSRDISLPAEWPLVGEMPTETLAGFLALCG